MGRSPPAKPAGAGANKPSGWGPPDNLAEPAEPAGAGADEPSGWGPPDNLAEPAESAGAGADEPSGWNRAAWQSEPLGFKFLVTAVKFLVTPIPSFWLLDVQVFSCKFLVTANPSFWFLGKFLTTVFSGGGGSWVMLRSSR